MTIQELIALLEEAEGPDRWLDAHIHGVHHNQKISVNEGGMVLTDYCVLGWIDPGKEEVNFNPSGIGEKMLRYTSSIDAAIALAEKVLPGMNCWGIEKDERGIEANVQRNGVKEGHWAQFSEHKTSAPIALVLSTLRALKQSEDRTE